MRKMFFILLLLPMCLSGQELLRDSKGEYIRLSLPQAGRIDYWSRKGLACDTLSSKYEQNIAALRAQERLQSSIIDNLQKAQEEYRGMVKQVAKDNKELTNRLARVQSDLELYKDKARRRGTTIAIGAGMFVLGTVAIIAIQ